MLDVFFKYVKLIISLILCILLIGCSMLKVLPKLRINSANSKYKKGYISEIGDEIIEYIKTKNKDGISSLFCNKVKDTEYLNSQINFIFDYIDKNGGIVIEDGKWDYPASHGSYDGSGSRSLQYFSCKYDGDVYINNKQYDLRFTVYQIFKNRKDYEGIITISIVEHMDSGIIDKAFEYREKNSINKRIFLGFDLFNIDYNTLQYMSILPKELNENEEYELLDSIENDR